MWLCMKGDDLDRMKVKVGIKIKVEWRFYPTLLLNHWMNIDHFCMKGALAYVVMHEGR